MTPISYICLSALALATLSCGFREEVENMKLLVVARANDTEEDGEPPALCCCRERPCKEDEVGEDGVPARNFHDKLCCMRFKKWHRQCPGIWHTWYQQKDAVCSPARSSAEPLLEDYSPSAEPRAPIAFAGPIAVSSQGEHVVATVVDASASGSGVPATGTLKADEAALKKASAIATMRGLFFEEMARGGQGHSSYSQDANEAAARALLRLSALKKASAIATMRGLFFEEMARGGQDANEADARALLRLSEAPLSALTARA